jgi:hypothetical protein
VFVCVDPVFVDALDVTLTSPVTELSTIATAVLSTPSLLSYYLHASAKSTALTVRLYKCVALVIDASIRALRGKRRTSGPGSESAAHFGAFQCCRLCDSL